MQEKMQLLKDLQELDQELNTIRQSRQELVSEREVLDEDLKRIQAMVDDLAAQTGEIEAQRKEVAQALNQEKDNVERAEGRLPGIKTQKEYVAVLKEIDAAKKLNKDLEEQIQTKDDDIAALSSEREEKEGELAAVQEKAESRKSEIAEALSGFEQSMEEKDSQRQVLLEKLPARIRKRYQMLLDRRGGVAIVEARRGTCLGCNMQLPPQLFNSLFQTPEIQTCPHCNRLLFVEQP